MQIIRPIAFDTAAANGYLAQIGTLDVKFSLGGFTIGGSASNFDIQPNGTLDTSKGFSVALDTNDPNATAKTFQLPSWLPFSISKLDLTWPDISDDPADFSIDLSASVGGTLGPVTLSGSVQDAVIDVGKLEQGQFPIDSLGGVGISVGGNLFGGKVSGSVFLADEVVGGQTVFYGGIEAGLDIEGLAGFEVRLGISQNGPLDAFVEVNAPIILDPDSGLAVTDLYGEVLFDDPLTGIAQPITSAGELLNNAQFTKPDSQTLQQWEDQLGQQVMSQASSSNPWDPFSQPITIKAGATLFDAYATTNAFELNGNLVLCTNGILEASGVLTVGDSISLTGAAYIDLSQVAAGKAALDFAVEAPSQAPLATIYGGIQFQYATAPTLLSSGPGSSPPQAGTGITLNSGISTDYATAQNINLNNTSYTVEFWARRNDTGRAETVIGQDDSQTGSGLKIGFDANNNLVVSSGGGTLTYASTDNLWHHWAVTYDQTTSTLTLFEDGLPVASGSAQPIQGASTTLIIGASGALNDYFDGSVDDLRVWSIARSASDIQANYGLATLGTGVAGLVADWAFTEGHGQQHRRHFGQRQHPHVRGQPGVVSVAGFKPDDHHQWRRRPDHPRLTGRARPVDQWDGRFPRQLEPGNARLEGRRHRQPGADWKLSDAGRHGALRPTGGRAQQHGDQSPRHLRHLRSHDPPELRVGEPGDQSERYHGPPVQHHHQQPA